jgi:hypothetical protein
VCARQGHSHGDSRDNGDDVMTGKNERQNKEERTTSGAPRGEDGGGTLLAVKFRQPSHHFTFGVGMNFISYPLVLTPVV